MGGSLVALPVVAESLGPCIFSRMCVVCSLLTGDNYLAPVLAVICGRDLPGPVRSTGEYMLIRFVSDSSVSGAGFNASVHKSNVALTLSQLAPVSHQRPLVTPRTRVGPQSSGALPNIHTSLWQTLSPETPSHPFLVTKVSCELSFLGGAHSWCSEEFDPGDSFHCCKSKPASIPRTAGHGTVSLSSPV